MNTFLPLEGMLASAETLDRRRLGKQRTEAKQLLKAVLGETSGYAHHPAAVAWQGHPEALAVYGLYVCAAWRDRGYVDEQFQWFQEKRLELRRGRVRKTKFPPWTEDPEVHAMFRQLLLWKDIDHYGPLFPEDDEPFMEPKMDWKLMTNG